MNELKLCNVNKHYGKKQAICNFNLIIEPGIYGLLGPNGSGKSTLMNLITDNISPDKDGGSILWNGKAIRRLGKKYRENLGYMPQQQELYPSMSARRFLGYLAALKGIPKKQAMNEINKLLNEVELSAVADQKIGGYSGGMKQRVLLAGALLGNPKILIMDEPTAGLDPRQRVIIRNLIEHLSKETIIIIATHITSDIEYIADKIIMMKNGSVIAYGSVENLTSEIKNAEHTLENLYLYHYDDTSLIRKENI